MAYHNTYKGIFKPDNPSKYKGDPTNIVYRSGWELKFMRYLDHHQNVLEWSSEELHVPYHSPVTGRVHRYFPDFIVKKRSKDGTIEILMIEIKPKVQTEPPKVQSKPRGKKYIKEVYTWAVNSAKWDAARNYCLNKGWKFVIMTEKELGV